MRSLGTCFSGGTYSVRLMIGLDLEGFLQPILWLYDKNGGHCLAGLKSCSM